MRKKSDYKKGINVCVRRFLEKVNLERESRIEKIKREARRDLASLLSEKKNLEKKRRSVIEYKELNRFYI